MFRAAMPDSNSVKTTAQLTDGSASWASPNSFTARQLWEWMPVDIFVQTLYAVGVHHCHCKELLL